jgi:MFS family permease
MVVARIVSGTGMGFINSTVPVFQSEFSPKAGRGLYVCMQLSTLNFGILLAYWTDYGFSSHLSSYAWRVPVILQCIFLLPMIPILLVVPETPRWLASHDRGDESLHVLQRLHRTRMSDESIRLLHADIMNTVALERSIGAGKWKDLLKNDSIQSQRRFFIACAIQAFQQLGGINAIVVRTPPTEPSTHKSLTLLIVLLGHPVPEERRIRPAYECFDGWLPQHLVLCRLVHSLVPD